MTNTGRTIELFARLNANRQRRVTATFVAAAAGGALFTALGLPAGWIAGSILVTAIFSLIGIQTEVPPIARKAIYIFLGILIGSAARPQILDQIATWPLSFSLLAIAMVLIIISTTSLLRRGFGWDRETAFFAGMPGALSIALATAEETNADMRKVAVTQSVRLLALIQLLPLVIVSLFGGDGIDASGVSMPFEAAGSPAIDFSLLIVLALAGSYLVTRFGIPGGDLLGSMLASAALYVTGTVDAALPDWMIIAGVVCLGAVAGSRFRPGDWPIMRGSAGAVLSAFGLALCISILTALLISWLISIPLPQALIAFSPGALDALTVLAFTMDLDPAYVAAHHVVRMFFLALTIPFLGRWLIQK